MADPIRKARAAAAVLRRYSQAQNEPEKEAAAADLNKFYEDIRFLHRSETGLTVICLETGLRGLPYMVRRSADTIIKVQVNGEAEVIKSRSHDIGPLQSRVMVDIFKATDLLVVELGGKLLEVVPQPRSRWELLNSDDWF